jgi:uncharacterized protein YdeI (YjbR/CyaY-like superfamily)
MALARFPALTRILYLESAAALRRWFEAHHATAAEVWVGYWKKASGESSVTWPESVDEALCVGWIDGIRKSVDERRYTIRFTPRRKGSIWSAVNVRRVEILTGQGRMLPAGLAAFAVRRENRSGIYAYEQRAPDLVEPYAGMLRKNKAAWKFFAAQPPWYRRTASWWITSAKRDETRLKRLATLIKDSSEGRTLRQLTRPPRKSQEPGR